jgi:ferritin-like metal-binding protein YciE
MNTGTLRGLWEKELLDLYSTEQRILAALPELVRGASSTRLQAALNKHLERTKIHVERLELIFKQCGVKPGSAAQPSGIDSILRAGSEQIGQDQAGEVRDAATIAAAQHVEHYEIAGYGCARTWARQLGDDNAAKLLQQTLDEEGAADKELTDIAESGINERASEGAGQERHSRSRLRYVDVDDLPSAAEYRDTKIRSRSGDELGRFDGFIVDPSGRPYYVVVDSGGLFVGRRYIVPIGRADFRRSDRVFTLELDKDGLKRYPEFNRDAYLSMSDEEARRYEWRVLEAVDPNTARTSLDEWDYDRLPYYRQPEWFDSGLVAPGGGGSRVESSTSRRREVPITDRDDRERVVASEQRYGSEMPPVRERIRGTGPEGEER